MLETVPAVIRSRRDLKKRGVSFVKPEMVAPSTLPITPDGATYNMAQEAAWIDAKHFAVGRWDGSLTVFAYNPAATAGPLITTAVSSPSTEGVQMVVWLAPGVFATSNDESSLSVWRSAHGDWTDLQPAKLPYDSVLGVANSADAWVDGGALCLAVGHASGFLSLWSGRSDGSGLQLEKTIDLRAPKPVNPWDLYNLRGVARAGDGIVLTGSEDGDLCIVRVADGQILSRTVYNPAAQRGINSIAVFGSHLLVANCSVGASDSNLWYYTIDGDRIELRDQKNLKIDPSSPQTFNFCTIWALYKDGVCFFASTEEGALWMGTQSGGKLSLIGYRQVTSPLGSALAFNVGGQLIMASHDLYEFVTRGSAASGDNPERLPAS